MLLQYTIINIIIIIIIIFIFILVSTVCYKIGRCDDIITKSGEKFAQHNKFD